MDKCQCPRCNTDISHLSYNDAIGTKIVGEFGECNTFICPHCGSSFLDFEVIYSRGDR